MNQIKNRYKIIDYLYIGIFLLFLNGCYDDKGNYDLLELNEIEITGIEGSYNINVGDVLIITPVLEFKKDKQESDLSYEWYKVDNHDNGTPVRILSEEFELELEAAGDFGVVSSHRIVYRIKDEATGVYYIKKFIINIGSNPLTYGYAALCEKADGFDLDVIAYYGKTEGEIKYILYKNVWREIMPEASFPQVGTPLAIQAIPNDPLAPYPGEEDLTRLKASLFVSTDQLTARVKYEDYSYLPVYDLQHTTSTYTSSSLREEYFPNGVVAEKILSYNWNNARAYMYINNNWFFYNTATATNYISYPINRTYDTSTKEFSKTFKTPSCMYATSKYGGIIFNEDENKFMVQTTSSNYVVLIQTTETNRVRDISEDPNNLFTFANPDYRLVYLGTIQLAGHDPGGFAFVKNVATNKYELLEFRLTSNTGNVEKSRRVEFNYSEAPDLENAKFFAYRKDIPYLYYATEDNIYCMYIAGDNIQTENISGQVLQSPYTKLSCLKYVLPWGPSTHLAVCTYDPNGVPGENGKFGAYIEFLGGTSEDEEGNEVIIPGTGHLNIATKTYETDEVEIDANGNEILDKEGNTIKIKDTQDIMFTGLGKVIDITYKNNM